MAFLGSKSAFFLLNTVSRVDGKSAILVSSDHSSFSLPYSESSRCFFGNFRWAGTRAFLHGRTLRELHGFIPLRYSVTNGNLGDCGPSYHQIINKFLTWRSQLFLHLSHHQVYNTSVDLVWNMRPGEIESLSVFLPFAYYQTNSWLLIA